MISWKNIPRKFNEDQLLYILSEIIFFSDTKSLNQHHERFFNHQAYICRSSTKLNKATNLCFLQTLPSFLDTDYFMILTLYLTIKLWRSHTFRLSQVINNLLTISWLIRFSELFSTKCQEIIIWVCLLMFTIQRILKSHPWISVSKLTKKSTYTLLKTVKETRNLKIYEIYWNVLWSKLKSFENTLCYGLYLAHIKYCSKE